MGRRGGSPPHPASDHVASTSHTDDGRRTAATAARQPSPTASPGRCQPPRATAGVPPAPRTRPRPCHSGGGHRRPGRLAVGDTPRGWRVTRNGAGASSHSPPDSRSLPPSPPSPVLQPPPRRPPRPTARGGARSSAELRMTPPAPSTRAWIPRLGRPPENVRSAGDARTHVIAAVAAATAAGVGWGGEGREHPMARLGVSASPPPTRQLPRPALTQPPRRRCGHHPPRGVRRQQGNGRQRGRFSDARRISEGGPPARALARAPDAPSAQRGRHTTRPPLVDGDRNGATPTRRRRRAAERARDARWRAGAGSAPPSTAGGGTSGARQAAARAADVAPPGGRRRRSWVRPCPTPCRRRRRRGRPRRTATRRWRRASRAPRRRRRRCGGRPTRRRGGGRPGRRRPRTGSLPPRAPGVDLGLGGGVVHAAAVEGVGEGALPVRVAEPVERHWRANRRDVGCIGAVAAMQRRVEGGSSIRGARYTASTRDT